MARYETALTTLQSRTIMATVRDYIGMLATRSDIENAGLNVVTTVEKSFPADFPFSFHNSYMAFALSSCAKEGIKRNELTVLDYISILASVKEENEENRKDFGAFGDLFEILVRCAMMRKINLVRWSMLSVKAINTADIVSKKYGIIEVGHNGKSLTYGTLYDYMDGDYTSVIYGVFNDEDKKTIYELCQNGQYDKAIDYVCSYSAYWNNKYEFQKDMDELTRGKGITKKGANIQIVYNESKYNAFVDALENGKIESLKETLMK